MPSLGESPPSPPLIVVVGQSVHTGVGASVTSSPTTHAVRAESAICVELHLVHFVAPSTFDMYFTPQVLHEASPAVAACFPTGHNEHSVAPVVPTNLPAGHEVQAVLLAEAANLPLSHRIQLPDPAVPLLYPAAHPRQ